MLHQLRFESFYDHGYCQFWSEMLVWRDQLLVLELREVGEAESCGLGSSACDIFDLEALRLLLEVTF